MVGRSVIDLFVGDEDDFNEGFVIVILRRQRNVGCMSKRNIQLGGKSRSRMSDMNITTDKATFDFNIEITINDPGILEHIGVVLGLNFGIYILIISLSMCFGVHVAGTVSIPNGYNPFSILLKLFAKPENDPSEAEKLVHENQNEVDGTNSKGFYIEIADISDKESTTNDTETSTDRTSTIRRVLNIGEKKSVRIIPIINKQHIN
jgi:hypothetical protein